MRRAEVASTINSDICCPHAISRLIFKAKPPFRFANCSGLQKGGVRDHMHTIDKKTLPPQDEKHPEVVTLQSVDSKDADEALELVGLRRELHFSEEYNKKLRRKLVSLLFLLRSTILQYYHRIGLFLPFAPLYILRNFCKYPPSEIVVNPL